MVQHRHIRYHALKGGKMMGYHRNGRGAVMCGGAAPLFLNSIIKTPIKIEGGDVSANTMVGIVSPPPPQTFGSGLESIHFHPKKSAHRENIKFVF